MARNRRERRAAERRARKNAQRRAPASQGSAPAMPVSSADEVQQLIASLMGGQQVTEVMPGMWVPSETADAARQALVDQSDSERFVCADGTELSVMTEVIDDEARDMSPPALEGLVGDFKGFVRRQSAELSGDEVLPPMLMVLTADAVVNWCPVGEAHPTAWFYDERLHSAVSALRPRMVMSTAHIWRHQPSGHTSAINPACVNEPAEGWAEWLLLCARDERGHEQSIAAMVVRDGRVWLDEWEAVSMAPQQRAWLRALVPLAPLPDASGAEQLTEALSRPRTGTRR